MLEVNWLAFEFLVIIHIDYNDKFKPAIKGHTRSDILQGQAPFRGVEQLLIREKTKQKNRKIEKKEKKKKRKKEKEKKRKKEKEK